MSEEGSEDSPPRPKRKIKKVMVLSSDSSSDSDEGVAAAGTRRKRLRVLSDEGSDSSGSSVVCVGSRRKRALPKLRDSEGDSDTSGWATDRSDAPKPTTSTAKPASGFASDSSEGNSDKCSICLLRFTNQEVGTPQSCEHIFCLDCITEWSKNVNTCPVDRMTFDFIVVRACAGGRVLRTEPVQVVERRPSVEMLVIEDPTICEVCGGTDSEESMLLCDGCDLGYHMACLTPPLHEVPIDQWLCPNCDDLLSDVDILFSGITARHLPLRQARPSSQLSQNDSVSDEPSTSTGRRGNRLNSDELPITSRGSRTSHSTRTRSLTTRRKPTTQRRRHKRRRTKTVIIEYEVQENGKFPVTETVKRKIKKRKSKRRQPRTAARRSHVRASVRARLESAGLAGRAGAEPAASLGVQELASRRHRAGIPALNLFGNPHEIEYFSEDDERGVSESASTAVAVRPSASILSAYRQARRKMISIPSPPHATSAPDVLSSILESQTLLHSKKSVVSIAVDGSVNIKLETRKKTKLPTKTSQEKETTQEKIDLSKSEDASKKAPSYPGQSRGGGGWGGGYRGNYHREQSTNNFNNRGGNNYENNYSGGGYQNRQGNANSYHQNNNMRRDDGDAYNNYSRRPHQYPSGDDVNFDRNRRQAAMDQNRGPNVGGNQRQSEQQQGRYSLAPTWQPYVPPAPAPRTDQPPIQHRHSFGGFENPLDMRMGQISRQNSANDALDMDSSQTAKHQAHPYRPLPEPPMFKFDKTPDVEKSEDERSDSGLVIDTEKYDPTEPTNDDDSADEETSVASAPAPPTEAPAPPAPAPPPPAAPVAALPPEQHAVQNILAGLDTSAMNVPPNVLDSAVRAVLKEHRNLIVPAPAPQQDRSDDDSEGDCPNFSIYSATSVHIANNADELLTEAVPTPAPQDSLEDLVQEDDDAPDEPSPPTTPPALPAPLVVRLDTTTPKKKSEEELKEKVSKRCPITTNPRNPIKIKLNTPSLIKRQMSLYDEEEEEMDEDIEPASTEPHEEDVTSPKQGTEKPSERVEENEDIPREKEPKELDKEKEQESVHEEDKEMDSASETDKVGTPPHLEESSTPAPMDTSAADDNLEQSEQEEDGEDTADLGATPTDNDKSGNDTQSEDDNDDLSGTEENDLPLESQSPVKDSAERNDDMLEKMTESISETEDERSYTPCLDENKSKDTSLETEKEKGIEGLDTEMISEDEGNEMFSDTERAASERGSPPRPPVADGEDGEIVDKKKDGQDTKKKKKKESKKEAKEKTKGKTKKSEVAFKKLSKNGKERNYRERDKDKEKSKRERRASSEGGARERSKQRRKERRKDLERYDVRTVVSEKRRRPKDAFGRDVSPRNAPRSRDASGSASPPPRRSCSPPARARRSSSPRATTPRARRASSTPRHTRVSPSPRSGSPRASPMRAPRRRPRDKRPEVRRRRDTERARKRRRSASGSRSPRPKPIKRKKRARSSRSGSRRRSPRRRSPRRRRARRRSASRTPERSPAPDVGPAPARSPGSVDSRLLSPRTPPPEPSPPPPSELRRARRRRDPERARHRRPRDVAGPSKEVFTSGDNILVSVSFKEQERVEGDERRERKRERRRRRRRAAAPETEATAVKPVAIIDLERSPFRELTPSPRNVIVLLSDDEAGEKEPTGAGVASAVAVTDNAHGAVGPKTPPEPAAAPDVAAPGGAEESRGPLTPPEPPDSPDAYDPYEPTRSASASPPSAHAASPPRALMTLEAAQKTNLSADDVIDRRPLSPIEKVMALLQSTRDVSPDEPPQGDAASSAAACGEAAAAPAPAPAPPAPTPATAPVAPQPASAPPVRIVLPSPTRSQAPKLFLAKPSPIKSDPIKPMPATKITRAAAPAARRADSELEADSPYSPGSSDFGDLFEPPGACRDPFDAIAERPARARKSRAPGAAAKVPVKLSRKKGKTQVGVKIDEDKLKILDDLPSSAVELQVKSKFLKKLNRQERVVEEVKLVLKPHYNKKHVTKDEYKDILRRAVPKICHNKSGEINPSKIQALVEAYVKKFRKKHKLGLL